MCVCCQSSDFSNVAFFVKDKSRRCIFTKSLILKARGAQFLKILKFSALTLDYVQKKSLSEERL